MTVVAAVAYLLLGSGALLALLRLARGPSLLDRVVATDTLLMIIACGLAVYAALEREPTLVPVLVVVSLLAFVGSVSIARYVGGMLLRSPDDDGQEAGLPPAAETAATGRAGSRRAARTEAPASEAARARPVEREDGA
jgi:multicomponent Na+:H+ antiporter subunit F